MPIISKAELLRSHYNGVLTEEIFDMMQKIGGSPFRSTDGGEHFDTHFLPTIGTSFMALRTKCAQLIAAEKAKKKQTESEIRETEIQRRVALALDKEAAKLRRNTLQSLAKELATDDDK